MARNQETLNKEMYDFLLSNGYEPKAFDVEGKLLATPDGAALIRFTFKDDEEDLGAARITINRETGVTIYFDNNIEHTGSHAWRSFLKQMKDWSMRKQLGFDLQNTERLKHDMAQRQYTEQKEKLGEGYYAMGKNMSYNDNVPSVKIILQHSRKLEEGEQRYRSIAKIFLENTDGERFLAPTTRPGIAQVYARHIAEGGVPNDERWNHVKAICEEYSKMAGFTRAVRKGQFTESAQQLVNEGINHYQSLRETLGKLRGHRGYSQYFESWTPALMEDDTDVDAVNQMFVQETMDPRIESVMPILAKLNRNVPQEVKEVSELADWADSIVEGEEILEIAPVVGAIAGRALAGAAGAGRVGKTVGSVVGQRVAGALSGNDDVEEGLDDDQKLVKQLGATEKVGPKGAVGKLVGEEDEKRTVRDRKTGKEYNPDDEFAKLQKDPEYVAQMKRMGKEEGRGWPKKTNESTISSTKVSEAKTFGDITIDDGIITKDGKKIGTVMHQVKYGYHPAVLLKSSDHSFSKWYELDQKNLIDTIVADVRKHILKSVEENLDADQKRVGQLGATEKVKNGAVGKLVGEAVAYNSPEESVIMDIVNGNIDAYDVMNYPKTPAQQKVAGILRQMYKQLAAKHGDDSDTIIDIMMDELSSEYDPYPMSESINEGQNDLEIIKRLLK